MKKLFKILGALIAIPIVLFLIAAIVIPIFFKEDIKRTVDETVQEYINANVDYKEDGLSISLFSDFPNAQVGLEQFSIVNKAPFDGDTLVSINDFRISLDVKSLLTSDLKINGIYLDQPRVFGQINKDGLANWDIVIPDTAAVDTSTSDLITRIDHWEIVNGHVEYDDAVSPMNAVLENINHSGKGVFGNSINLLTQTTADKAYLNMSGVTYLNNVALDANTDLEMVDNTINLGENNLKLNDLNLLFKGSTTISDDETLLDFELETKQNTFKNLLSLVPAVFLEGYEEVEANGNFNLDASVKGKLTEDQYPAFHFCLDVKEGDFKHPELPKKISDINFYLRVENKDGNLDNTSLELKDMNLKMGENFLSGRLAVEGINTYLVDTDISAKLNLDEVKDFYPLDGNVLKGKLDMNVKGKGTVDLDNNQFPALNGYVNLSNGFAKTKDFNLPVEDVNFASVFSSDGTTQGTNVSVKNIQMKLDKDEFGGHIDVNDFEAFNYNADLNGRIDLGKLFTVFPVEGTNLTGVVDVKSFTTKGNLAAIEEENYQVLETSGSAKITNLKYQDNEYLPNGLSITSSNVQFTPDKIMIDDYTGFVGKNDVKIQGYVSNYMGYLFGESDTVIGGKMSLQSKKFDVNPLLSEEEVATTSEPTIDEPVVPVPKDIHFFFDATMDELIYDDLTLSNFNGGLEVVNGMVKMDAVKFKTLGASFLTSGVYNTSDPKNPKYDFKLNVDDMQIKEAYKYFSIVKSLSPVAEKVDGFFNTDISVSGNLLDGYMPDMNSLNMDGGLDIVNAVAKVTDVKMLSGIAEKTKLSGLKEYKISNQKMDIKVKNGQLWVSPFTMNGGDVSLITQVNTGISDGKINHHMNLDAPSSSLKSGIGSLGLDPSVVGDRIKLDFDVIGTMTNPKIDIKNAVSDGIKSAVKDKVESKVDNAKQEAADRAKAEVDKAKQEAADRAEKAADEAKAKAVAKAKVEAEKAKDKAADKVKDALKDKLPWGK